MLCALCGRLEREGKIGYFLEIPGLTKWWGNHKEEDRIRLDREREERERSERKRRALNKLTAEDRKALGL